MYKKYIILSGPLSSTCTPSTMVSGKLLRNQTNSIWKETTKFFTYYEVVYQVSLTLIIFLDAFLRSKNAKVKYSRQYKVRFLVQKTFSPLPYFGRGFCGVSGDIYIKILMMPFSLLPSHISLCKTLRVSDSKYGHQLTNTTIESNRSLVGS